MPVVQRGSGHDAIGVDGIIRLFSCAVVAPQTEEWNAENERSGLVNLTRLEHFDSEGPENNYVCFECTSLNSMIIESKADGYENCFIGSLKFYMELI